MAEIGSIIDGKYEILTEIGHGGMSVVYLAMDTHLNKQWAVKEIKKKSNGANDQIIVNSLLAEANLMKRLDHPALPRIVDIIDNGYTIYVVMDYIEGESLDKILANMGPQSEELVIGWAKQLCDALSYLHSQKPPIIYRDMKPANIMLKPEGNIKIIDFGIAREYKELSLQDTTVLGTKGYAPPEQYSGQTDARSDIYALGMTLHHLLTGVDPRKCEGYAPVRMYNPNISEGMELIIDKCVQPAQENRYQNCADLLYDLEHPELITKGYKKKQKRKLGLFVASLVLSAALFVTGFVCNKKAVQINNNEYDKLVNANDLDARAKAEKYEKAIAIYPNKKDAYMKYLDLVISDDQEDSFKRFKKEYDKYEYDFPDDSIEMAFVVYRVGAYVCEEYGESNAKSYFEKLYNNLDKLKDWDETYKKLTEVYYIMCTAGRTSIGTEDGEDYTDAIDSIEGLIDGIEKTKQNDAMVGFGYTVIAKYLLNKSTTDGKFMSEIDEERTIGLYEKTYEMVEKYKVGITDQNKKKYKRLIDNKTKWLEQIEKAYNDKNANKQDKSTEGEQ